MSLNLHPRSCRKPFNPLRIRTNTYILLKVPRTHPSPSEKTKMALAKLLILILDIMVAAVAIITIEILKILVLDSTTKNYKPDKLLTEYLADRPLSRIWTLLKMMRVFGAQQVYFSTQCLKMENMKPSLKHHQHGRITTTESYY